MDIYVFEAGLVDWLVSWVDGDGDRDGWVNE